MIEINGGMIQDWQGAVFINGAKLDQVLRVVQDYPNHAKYYSPDVMTSKVVSRSGDHWLVVMRTLKSKLFLSDVLETENDITFMRVNTTKVYAIAKSTRIQEVADSGKDNEHLLPEGRDRGLLWRLYGYWFYEERDGGVYVECESGPAKRYARLQNHWDSCEIASQFRRRVWLRRSSNPAGIVR